jgi:hypothetical protein
MAVTVHFNNENDIAAGGRWSDDYGKTICTWTYALKSREIEVRCGSVGRRQPLPTSDVAASDLKDRLARLAIEIAEDLRGTKYDF